MQRIISVALGSLLAAAMIAFPIWYYRWEVRESRNFRVVEDGVLYRSGQLSLSRLKQAVSAHGIRTVISLRDGNKQDDQDEEAWINARGLKFVRIPPRKWYPDESGKIPADMSLQEFRDVMDDLGNYPVLVHCFAGIHRTGAMCAVFRMDYQGWTNAQAMTEMREMGYTILDDHEDVRGYMLNYHPPRKRNPLVLTPVSRSKNSLP